jgi:hypothetical protein
LGWAIPGVNQTAAADPVEVPNIAAALRVCVVVVALYNAARATDFVVADGGMNRSVTFYVAHVTQPENHGQVEYSEPGREHSKFYLG